MFITVIILCLALYSFYKVYFKLPNGMPPGECGWPIIGFLPSRGESITKLVARLAAKHGDIFSVKLGQRTVVFLADFATIKYALGKPEFNGRPELFTMQLFRRFQNKGIVFSDGSVWHTNRIFALKALKDLGLGRNSLSTAVSTEVEHLIKQMMKNVGKPAKIDWCLNLAIVNVIMRITAGQRYNLDAEEDAKYVKFITEAAADIGGPIDIFNIYPCLIWVLPNFIKNKFFKIDDLVRRTDEFLNYLRGLIREHENTLDKDNPRDFIDMYLIEHQEQKGSLDSTYVDDDYFDLVSVLSDLYGAGSETTSSTIRWYCYYMAKYPEIQNKIQAELDSVVPDDRMILYEDRKRLPYFEATIHELQRIVSIVPMGIPHATTQDTVLNGYKIPKNTMINSCISFCHQSPKYWKHPTQFYPEHFLDENGAFSLPKEGYLPFMTGRRVCLGESLAKMELILYLGSILRTFHINEPKDQAIELDCGPGGNSLLNFPRSQELILTKRFSKT